MDLVKSIETSLIDQGVQSDGLLQHKLLVNNKHEKVAHTLIKELSTCTEFHFSVAFITNSGLVMLLPILKELEERGIKGKILTGNYLTFTNPEALRKIMQFSNIELKMLTSENLHAKGYFFKHETHSNVIIGSSNLTQAALTKTSEWNLKFSSLDNGLIIRQISEEFVKLWSKAEPIEGIINEYEYIYNQQKKLQKSTADEPIIFSENRKITPNSMQIEALNNLNNLRADGEDKALLVSATGTGKTYLSAFELQQVNAKTCMFVVHRENIAKAALETFKTIMPEHKYGMFTGNRKDLDADYLFVTIQSLHNNLELFDPEQFEYIIYDEIHHGGAKTYQKVFNHFKPKFTLGMTATPERGDDFNIFEMFDYNIAHEIRLNDAFENDLLTPFHYFGVEDITVDGQVINEKSSVSQLTKAERIRHIDEKVKYYGHGGDKLKGLMFVSSVLEAKVLSEELNNIGYNTKALTGSDSETVRDEVIKQLEKGELDYIITRDIFNEGVDIPCVNQIVLLRPTQSAIVYVQQLGRGLRLSPEKKYVVVIDFIGNYENNFMIPMAIGQNNTYNKDALKKDVILNGVNVLSGSSTLHFEEVARKRIFENINKVNMSKQVYIRHDFDYLERRLGRTPMLLDFYEHELIAPQVILKGQSSYPKVVKKLRKKLEIQISETGFLFLEYFNKQVLPAKRIHEVAIVLNLLEEKEMSLSDLVSKIESQYELKEQYDYVVNACQHLSKQIFTSLSDTKKYPEVIVFMNDKVQFTEKFKECLKEKDFVTYVLDMLKYGEAYYLKEFNVISGCQLNRQYDKKEAFKYNLVDYSNGYQVSGYTLFDKEKIGLLFITLDDSGSFSNYENPIENRDTITWFSKANRQLERDGKLTKEGKIAEGYYTLKVFIKKTSSEEFYYLGNVGKVLSVEIVQNVQQKPAVKYQLKLENKVEESIYEYLFEG